MDIQSEKEKVEDLKNRLFIFLPWPKQGVSPMTYWDKSTATCQIKGRMTRFPTGS